MDYPIISQEELKEVFSYNKSTGKFIRIAKKGVILKTGTTYGDSRISKIMFKGNQYHTIVLIWMFVTGEWREFKSIKFNDRDKLNFRWDNLVEYDYSKDLISHQDLLSLVNYNDTTGVLQWNDTTKTSKINHRIHLQNRQYSIKRIIHFYMTGKWNFSRYVRCIDENEQNLKWSNLTTIT